MNTFIFEREIVKPSTTKTKVPRIKPDPQGPQNLKELTSKIEDLFKMEPEIERDIQIQLGSVVSQMYRAALESNDGFCHKFSLPLTVVHSFYKKIKINPPTVEKAFRSSWNYPVNAHMYSEIKVHYI